MATRAEIEAELAAEFHSYQIGKKSEQPDPKNPWDDNAVLFYRVRAVELVDGKFKRSTSWIANIDGDWRREEVRAPEPEDALESWASHADRNWTLCALAHQARYRSGMATVVEAGVVRHVLIYPSGSSFASVEIPEILTRF